MGDKSSTAGGQTRVNLATLTVLKNSNWFRGIADELLREIAALSVTRNYAVGETIFQRDEPGDYLFGVIAGSIRVAIHSPDGRELALNTMGPGDIIGEIAVLDGGVRTATGRATEPTQVFVVPREPFAQLMRRQPDIALHMIELLCERVRHAHQQVEEAAFLTLPQRLGRQLVALANTGAGALPVTIKISQGELATFLNASRQLVNGCLQGWQKQGYVSLKRGSIVVHDLDGLLEESV